MVDAGTLVYPGLAPATLFVSPLTIPGNSMQTINVCVTDALGIPLRGVVVGFAFEFTGGGDGRVDGHQGSGTFNHTTKSIGCTQGTAVTSNVPSSTMAMTAGTLDITAAGQSAQIMIQSPVEAAPPPSTTATLTVNVDNQFGANAVGIYTVTLAASGSSGGFSPPGQSTSCTLTTSPDTTPPNMTANTCTFTVEVGTVVALSAASAPAGTAAPFEMWGTGDCSSAGTSPSASVTVSSAGATCTALFNSP